MAFDCKILADSIGPSGVRLTTFEVTFPRIILAEVNTHRMLSRNSASSRAIPTERLIARVLDDPYVPIEWGVNQKGMQSGDVLDDDARRRAAEVWLDQRDAAIAACRTLHEVGLHKQWANRPLEPFMWHTAIISATEWANFFALRNHEAAMPEFRHIAAMMEEAYEVHVPATVVAGAWHTPLVFASERRDLDPKTLLKVSAARCARVSYLTHDGQRSIDADLELFERLSGSRPGHWSPFEHVARAVITDESSGNFRGWLQYRKTFASENIDDVGLRVLRAKSGVANG